MTSLTSTTPTLITEIKEFSKLYKVPIPYHKEFSYYINTLMQSEEFKHLNDCLYAFKQIEDKLPKYKFSCMDMLITRIKESQTYADFNDFALSTSHPTMNHIKQHLGELMFSIDIKKANYTILKSIDAYGDMCNSWDQLCAKLEIDKALRLSKSFRQMVFGNLNPKRNQRLQHNVMAKVCATLPLAHRKNIIFISHDEIVILCESQDQAKDLKHFVNKDLHKELGKKIADRRNVFEFGTQLYVLNEIEKDRFAKTINPNTSQSIKTLVGIPSNQFYIYFKKHILEQPLDERDLYFYNDHRLAKWVI